jgi:hypothetical protein
MPDRPDVTAGIIAILAYLVALTMVLLNPSIRQIADLVILIPNFVFAAYWAFSLTKALVVPTYRRQTLGIGIVVLAVFSVLVTFLFFPTANTPASNLIQIVAFYTLFLVLFYWIDASVLTTRRYDPLLRDVLYWRKIRVPLWLIIIVSTAIPVFVSLYIAATSNTLLFNQLVNGTLGGPLLSSVLNIIVGIFPIVIPICGIVYLPAIALRAKWDKNLRMHFVWFAPTSICLILIFFGALGSSNSLPSDALIGVIVTVMGYTLYRSAKALVPMNRISTADIAKAENPPS